MSGAGGGGGKMLTLADKGGRGIRQMLTMADRGGRGGLAYPDITDKKILKWSKIKVFIKHILTY